MSEHFADPSFRLYFAHQRVSGLEMNISRFYARLADPDPAQRPHASLRDAMVSLSYRTDRVRARMM